jgi:hypothetical protein
MSIRVPDSKLAPLADLIRTHLNIAEMNALGSSYSEQNSVICTVGVDDQSHNYMIFHNVTACAVGLRHFESAEELSVDFFRNGQALHDFNEGKNPNSLDMISVRYTHIVTHNRNRVEYDGKVLASVAESIYEYLTTGNVFVTKRTFVPLNSPGNVR